MNIEVLDDSGCFVDDAIGICNRRLSIIDLTGGHQPIHNGEIYNFENLERVSHRFYTDSDTEMIVHACEEWQLNYLGKFNGMFAFALWD